MYPNWYLTFVKLAKSIVIPQRDLIPQVSIFINLSHYLINIIYLNISVVSARSDSSMSDISHGRRSKSASSDEDNNNEVVYE